MFCFLESVYKIISFNFSAVKLNESVKHFVYFQVQQRYVLCAVLFLSLGVTFTLRMIFTLILTQMVYIPNVDLNNSSYSSSNSNDGRYQWSQELQGIILSSFSWGNLFSQLPSGILVQKFGGKITFLISALSSAVVVAVIPLSVTYG